MPTHQRLRLDNRYGLQDRRETSIHLDKERAVVICEPSPAFHDATDKRLALLVLEACKPQNARRVANGWVSKYRNRIHLHRMDAIDFIDHVAKDLPSETFLCIDPPYFNKGATLYTSLYMPEDHEEVARRVLRLKNPWVLTYDYCDELQDLYTAGRQFKFALNYSVQTKRVESELLIPAKGLRMRAEFRDCQIHQPTYRSAA